MKIKKLKMSLLSDNCSLSAERSAIFHIVNKSREMNVATPPAILQGMGVNIYLPEFLARLFERVDLFPTPSAWLWRLNLVICSLK